jgi:hypothetical protein
MNKPTLLQESPDFSLVLGGPLFQLLLRAHLSGNALELLHRRILAILLIPWLPFDCPWSTRYVYAATCARKAERIGRIRAAG